VPADKDWAAMKVRSVLVVGSGSAGLLAALALKRRLPGLTVRVVSSSRLGIIGVGEGTVPSVPAFIHGYLGLDESGFFSQVDPVYKLGVRFRWGRRDYFDYTFSNRQWAWQWPELGRPSGFFAEIAHHGIDLPGALMEAGHALPTRGAGFPDVPPPGQMVAWHLENHRFVAWLEQACQSAGIEFADGEIATVTRTPSGGVASLELADGRSFAADLFVDASGFRSELLGKVLDEPFESFTDSLFCDRAVVGGWEREQDEPILPYTLSDTMDCGWAWRIDHPERINRGYVYSSDHIDDSRAEAEFRARNPKIGSTRLVKFRSGCRRRVWVDNVVAVGNAGGFVEPLEATAIMCICLQSKWLADGLIDSQQSPPPTMRRLYNRYVHGLWDEIREFLSLHYRLNDRLDTPFWHRCRHETRLGFTGELLDFYRENGASQIGSIFISKDSPFGLEGYYAMLVGMRAPMEKENDPAAGRRAQWLKRLASMRQLAEKGMTMETARRKLRDPKVWKALRQAA